MKEPSAELKTFYALLKYAEGLENLDYTGASVLVAYYKGRISELIRKEKAES